MSNEQKHDNDQQQFWQMAIETWQASGLSVRNFCRKEGLSEPTLYSWRKKLAKADGLGVGKQKDTTSAAFIEVAMPKSEPVALELVLSSGNTLRISPGADSKTLTNVLSALCEVGLC